MEQVIRKKDLKWLQHIGMSCTTMYDGLRVDFLPSGPAHRLYSKGLIRTEIPHNPVHKERWVLTERGQEVLQWNR